MASPLSFQDGSLLMGLCTSKLVSLFLSGKGVNESFVPRRRGPSIEFDPSPMSTAVECEGSWTAFEGEGVAERVGVPSSVELERGSCSDEEGARAPPDGEGGCVG